MKSKSGVGAQIWFAAIFFGLVGQVAWIVENMYFATLAQDIFANSGRADMAYLVTTLMVILSALTATATTVIAGGLCDRSGRRKPFCQCALRREALRSRRRCSSFSIA